MTCVSDNEVEKLYFTSTDQDLLRVHYGGCI